MDSTKKFTAEELETLLSVADTIIPSLTDAETDALQDHVSNYASSSTPDANIVAEFARQCPSMMPDYVQDLSEVVPTRLPKSSMVELKQALSVLRMFPTMLVLAGSVTPFHQLPRERREAILLSWKNSSFYMPRKLFCAFATLSLATYFRCSPILHQAAGFPSPKTYPPVEPSKYFKFDFQASTAEFGAWTVDAVIIGSGSGGGVVAKRLAEAGLRVLVVEKGKHVPNVGLSENEALAQSYENGGVVTAAEGGVFFLAGSVFGGGSSVNWAAALQTPACVRKDWAKNHKLPFFTSTAFQESLDRVCNYMGVSEPAKHNHANIALMEGARRLGYAHKVVPQNTGGPNHDCGHECANGCRHGQKKGGVHAWLVDAAKAGAVFMEQTYVSKVVLDKRRRATGVVLRLVDGSEVEVKAGKVIISAGALHSAALLLRSGLQNRNIGKNLRVHPVCMFHAAFNNRDISPTSGGIITSIVTEKENLDGNGHGVRVEALIMQPTFGCSGLPWNGGLAWKQMVSRYTSLAAYFAMARDRGSGRVVLHPDNGEPKVEYSVSNYDAQNIVEGVIMAAECLIAAGADEIITSIRGAPTYKVDPEMGKDAPSFQKWVKHLRLLGGGDMCQYASAHLQSSNRMGTSPSDSVVDCDGKVWGTEGLYIADGSILPSASGVNPMVTIMAVADHVSSAILKATESSSARL